MADGARSRAGSRDRKVARRAAGSRGGRTTRRTPDTAVLLAALPSSAQPVFGAAADYGFDVPVRGSWATSLIGVLPVRRSGDSGYADLLAAVRPALRADAPSSSTPRAPARSTEPSPNSVPAPCGSRECGVPLVPVAVMGTADVLPRAAASPRPDAGPYRRTHRREQRLGVGAARAGYGTAAQPPSGAGERYGHSSREHLVASGAARGIRDESAAAARDHRSLRWLAAHVRAGDVVIGRDVRPTSASRTGGLSSSCDVAVPRRELGRSRTTRASTECSSGRSG